MAKRAIIVTSPPKNRDRIRRATKDDIRGQGIDGAIESYLMITSAVEPPKR